MLRAYLSELCNLDPEQFVTEDVSLALREIGYSDRSEGEATWPIFGFVLRHVNEQRAQRIARCEVANSDVTAAVKRTLLRFEKKPPARYEVMTIEQEDAETKAKYAKLQQMLGLKH